MIQREVDATTVRELLKTVRQHVTEWDVRYLSEGWDNRLYLVNEELVVRVAKTLPGTNQLLREAAVLSKLAPMLPLKVPRPAFIHPPSDTFPFAAMGYYLLPGGSLRDADATPDHIGSLAPHLARFLTRLHAVPVDLARSWGVSEFTPSAWLASHDALVQDTIDVLGERLKSSTFRCFLDWWMEYRNDPVAVSYTPRFIHGDLACEHVLVDRETWQITGVIDFGDAQIADPALDLAGLPNDLARAVMRQMPNLVDAESVWRRRVAYDLISPLHAISVGRDRSDETLIREGIDGLELRFAD